MEFLFKPKIEEESYEMSSVGIKKEDYPEDGFFVQIKTEEEESLVENLARHNDQRFEQLFANLNQYLMNFIDVEDFELPYIYMKDKENETIILEAKKDFKQWSSNIIESLADDLRQKSVAHLFPNSYIVQIVETTKRRIFASYKQLKKNIIETLTLHSEDNKFKEDSKPKKAIRKNKYDFPTKAQTILRLWFIANARDPYPSHEEKIELARKGGISMKQLDNWFTNTRGRIWKHTQKDEPKFEKQIADILFNKI